MEICDPELLPETNSKSDSNSSEARGEEPEHSRVAASVSRSMSSVKVARGFTPGTPGLPGGFSAKKSCPGFFLPGGFRVPRGFCPELDSCPGFSPGLDSYPGFVPEVRFLPGVESVGVSSTRGLGNSKLNFGNTILTQNTCISEKKNACGALAMGLRIHYFFACGALIAFK